jgi:hypothetical protein
MQAHMMANVAMPVGSLAPANSLPSALQLPEMKAALKKPPMSSLWFDEAVMDILKIKPEPKPPKKTLKAKKRTERRTK